MYQFVYMDILLMAHRAIPMIAFPWVQCMLYIIIYNVYIIYVCVTCACMCCILLRHSRKLGQLMGVAHNKMRA